MKIAKDYPKFYRDIRKKIEERLWKAGYMVEGDAKRICPVDTGNLRSSIHTAIDKDSNILTAQVGSNVFYAPYVELGTRFMGAKPFLRPALENNRAAIARLFNAGSF